MRNVLFSILSLFAVRGAHAQDRAQQRPQMCVEYTLQREGHAPNIANRIDGAFGMIFEQMELADESVTTFETIVSVFQYEDIRVPYSYTFSYNDSAIKLHMTVYQLGDVSPHFIVYADDSMNRFMDRAKAIFGIEREVTCTGFMQRSPYLMAEDGRLKP